MWTQSDPESLQAGVLLWDFPLLESWGLGALPTPYPGLAVSLTGPHWVRAPVLFLMFIVILRERESRGGAERERERGRERQSPSRLCTDSKEPDVRLELTN